MTTISILMTIAEWIGTAAFAISGALTAIHRGLDIFGVVFIGCITATGGGMLRDVLCGNIPPSIFRNAPILILAAVCSLIIFIVSAIVHSSFSRFRESIEKVNLIFDSIGLSIFSVFGVQIAVSVGYGSNAILAVFLGMTTAVGGGAMRDIMTKTIPDIFVKHVYALASIAGAIIYYVLYQCLNVSPGYSTIAASFSVFLLRMLAATHHWELPKIKID